MQFKILVLACKDINAAVSECNSPIIVWPDYRDARPCQEQGGPLILQGASLLLANWQEEGKSCPQMTILGHFQ